MLHFIIVMQSVIILGVVAPFFRQTQLVLTD
jgi:hypothetical protein